MTERGDDKGVSASMMEWIGDKLKLDCHCSPHTPDAFQKIEWEKRGFTQVNGKLGLGFTTKSL